jgi:hypothetical protein
VVPKGPVGLLKSQVSAFAGDNTIPPIVTVRAVARATCLSATTEREARKNGQGFRPIYIQYNNIEKRHDEDGADVDGNANGDRITGWIAPDDVEPIWDETRQRLSRRLALVGRKLGVPRESIGVDENPNRNGGRFPKKIIGSPGFQISRASFRSENPLPLREYLKANPTAEQYQADPSRIRGSGSPLGIIGYLAKDAEHRAKRRLAQVGRRLYAQQLAAKDRHTAKHRPLQRHLYEGALPKPNQFRKSKKYSPLTKAHLKEIREAKPRRNTAMFNATGVQSGWQMRGDAPPDHTLVRTISWEQHTQNAKRRMNALIVAVDNGVENGTIKYNNAVQLGGGVHRADRGDRHDIRTVRRTAGKSSA